MSLVGCDIIVCFGLLNNSFERFCEFFIVMRLKLLVKFVFIFDVFVLCEFMEFVIFFLSVV